MPELVYTLRALKTSYSLGHAQIDEEHHNLLDLAFKLSRSTTAVELKEVSNELLTHLNNHSISEEALMKAADYPDFYAHYRIHRYLIECYILLEQGIHASRFSVATGVEFFFKLLTLHQLDDKKFVDYLNAKNGKP